MKLIIVDRLRLSHLLLLIGKGGGFNRQDMIKAESFIIVEWVRVEACNRQEKLIIVDRLMLSHLLLWTGKGGGL